MWFATPAENYLELRARFKSVSNSKRSSYYSNSFDLPVACRKCSFIFLPIAGRLLCSSSFVNNSNRFARFRICSNCDLIWIFLFFRQSFLFTESHFFFCFTSRATLMLASACAENPGIASWEDHDRWRMRMMIVSIYSGHV